LNLGLSFSICLPKLGRVHSCVSMKYRIEGRE
jgi:hypothetical protein